MEYEFLFVENDDYWAEKFFGETQFRALFDGLREKYGYVKASKLYSIHLKTNNELAEMPLESIKLGLFVIEAQEYLKFNMSNKII